MDVTQLGAILISAKEHTSHHKSMQVHARTGETESRVDPSFQLASTCETIWPGLNVIVNVVLNYLYKGNLARAAQLV